MDLVYSGDKNKWLKFAYGLKARYTMRLLARASNRDAEMDKVLDYISKSYTSVRDQAALDVYDADNLNPLFDFQWSRDGLAASESMADKLIERDDPRLRRVFVDADWEQVEGPDAENYFMAPNGDPEQLRYYYNTSTFVYSQVAPTLYLSYHELMFLKAEALVRKGQLEDAEEALKEAVLAAIANTETGIDAADNAPAVLDYGGLYLYTDPIEEEEAEAYFDDVIKPLFDEDPLQEVMMQKYIGFFGASGESTEAYNDIRRLKALNENLIPLSNPNPFPLRLPYGNSDTTTNPEVKAAYGNGQYVYTEPVWWAGGNR
jgi:tetratricopeptide (TPR) repeat protein